MLSKLIRLASWLKGHQCDHAFFPVMVGGEPIAQKCDHCGKFKSLGSLGSKKEGVKNDEMATQAAVLQEARVLLGPG